jgi:hypothetical protein
LYRHFEIQAELDAEYDSLNSKSKPTPSPKLQPSSTGRRSATETNSVDRGVAFGTGNSYFYAMEFVEGGWGWKIDARQLLAPTNGC